MWANLTMNALQTWTDNQTEYHSQTNNQSKKTVPENNNNFKTLDQCTMQCPDIILTKNVFALNNWGKAFSGCKLGQKDNRAERECTFYVASKLIEKAIFANINLNV